MKKILLLFFIITFPIQVHARMAWNCFEPQYPNTRVTHKQYYGERFIEPYRWGNPFEKPVKQWYRDGVEYNRRQNKKDLERYGIIQFRKPDVPFW